MVGRRPLQEVLVEYIKASPQLRLIGTPSTGVWDRVAQVSFLHTKLGASEVVAQLNKAGICCRNGQPRDLKFKRAALHSLTDRLLVCAGHMFAYRCADVLPDVGTGVEDGCVRMSLTHYNTPEECERCIAAIESLVF